MASTEPYFYDAAYSPVKRNYAIPIDEYGKCTLAKLVCTDEKGGTKTPPMKWECTSECKSLTDCEVNAILGLKSAFDQPIQSVRQALDTFDSGCPNEHYTKLVHDCTTELMGHPLVCYNGGGCLSKLRILRTGAVHYPVLRTLLRLTYSALSSHTCVKNIDKALCDGDFQTLMEIAKISDYNALLSNEVEKTYTQCTEAGNDVFLQPGIEDRLLDKHAQIITEYEKEVDDYPNRICCSCVSTRKNQ